MLDLFSGFSLLLASVGKLGVRVVTYLPLGSQDALNPIDQDPQIRNGIQHSTKLGSAILLQSAAQTLAYFQDLKYVQQFAGVQDLALNGEAGK